MRIAQVISSLIAPLGGAEQYCLEVARGQVAAGHEVTILTGWASDSVVESLAADGIGVRIEPTWRPYPPDRKSGSRLAAALFHGLDLLGSVVPARRMRRALREDWDLVHVHRVAGFGSGILRAPSAPVVFTVHDYSLVDTGAFLVRNGVVPDGPSRVQALRTSVIRRTLGDVHLVFPSERLRGTHARWGLDHPGTDSVIPHGWRLESSPAADSAAAGAEGSDIVASDGGYRQNGTPHERTPVVFLFLGKLLADKGIELLLDAWGDGIPGAELRFAGAGPDAAPVERAAADGRVRMLGWVDEDARRAALAAADVLVLPSLWPENFQLAAAEGVLAGLPIVSTTIAAPPVVEDGVSGVLAAPTASGLRSALEALVDDAERERLAVGTRARAADLDFDLHLRRVHALYASLGAGIRPVRGSIDPVPADDTVDPTVRRTPERTAR